MARKKTNQSKIKYGCDCSVRDDRLDFRHSEYLYTSTHNYINWGRDNRLPNYYYYLYENCSTLQIVIDQTTKYIKGDGIEVNPSLSRLLDKANAYNEPLIDIICNIILDYCIFGSFNFQIINSRIGKVAELYNNSMIDFRISEDEKTAYINEDWRRSIQTGYKYPIFDPRESFPTSYVYYKNPTTRGWYSKPRYYAALDDIEVQIEIQQFHKNLIRRNFSSTAIVNVNSGIVDDEVKTNMVEDFNLNYTGTHNAGKTFFIFNESQAEAATVERINDDNYDQKYTLLKESTQQPIFAHFSVTPNLVGIPTKTTGFSEQEYNSAYKLYNDIAISPMQDTIEQVFDRVFQMENSIRFKRFKNSL